MKKRILFLAANPVGTTALKLDEEARAIREELQRANQRDQFEFVTRLAARPLDMLRSLRDVKPTIAHFAGHAGADGVYFVRDDGRPAHVTRETLRATFGAAGKSVQIVLLNGCATEEVAEALCELVPVSVGTSAAIGDEAARVFSIGFYGALAACESAAQAYAQGKAAMHLEQTGDHEMLHLHHRRDVDPDLLVVASAEGRLAPRPVSPRSPVARSVPPQPAVIEIPAQAAAAPRSAAGTDLIAPLVMLQVSDLQFGPHSHFAGCDLERLAAQCRQALDEARGDLGWREAVDLVLVTGDIAEAARPPEYASATTFFTALARQLTLPTHRLVFVPGNHDVSWTRCREVQGQLEDGWFPACELRTRLDEAKLAHYERFVRDVHGGRLRDEVDGAAVTSLAHGVFVHDFADLGVSVAALDSCERESHRAVDHVGALSEAQVQAVLDHWRTSPAELIRIVAVHHNPAPMASPAVDQWLRFLRASYAELGSEVVERIATDFVGFEGRDHLRNLASDAHVSLMFHGHHQALAAHQAWAWRGRDPGGAGDARILSAGSWGVSPAPDQLPKDQSLVMQLVRLDPTAAALHAVLLTYDPRARLPGEVRPGRFLLDAQTRDDRLIGLSLPPGLRGRFRGESLRDRAPEVMLSSPASPRAGSLDAAIEAYRARKAGSFERWDLRTAGPQPTAGNRPAEIALDEMYIPLRFAGALDPSERDLGAPISPEDLVQIRSPQIVIGGAGSGKTTWMRWTFRRLIRDRGTVPFFLELRAIAAAWTTPQCAARAIDSYLVAALTESGVFDADAVVAELLGASSGPQPVLLIDGWDELGGHGERVRERLVEFCRAFPRFVVVASSRPYGETRPASAEAFETLYIQPLSDRDVGLLATHFHRRVHGLDEPAGARATEEFMSALAAAPDARSLASTALLLTMMLLVSREGPLPDRRHKLYTACLRNMLLHRVDLREREGAVIGLDQWRPHDSEERLRVVAELAYRIQAEGYLGSRRAPMVRSWDVAVGLLRSDWTRDRREQFLRWLVASAGVLVDRTDGSVQFAHLSFQEHLAAYYLFITREGDERLAVVRDHMGARDWWETLRLWAGLTGDHWPDKLSPVLTMLCDHAEGYWLAGMIFADGTGSASDFAAWVAELPARLYNPFSTGDDCALAWRVCKQADRRAALAARLVSARETARWLEAIWHVQWCRLADLEVAPAPALLALEAPIGSAGGAARARVVFGGAACWPNGGELTVLRLWPSSRAMLGVRLQAALSLGARANELVVMLAPLLALATRSWNGEDHELAETLIRDFIRDFGRFLAREFGSDFGRDLGRYAIRCFGREFIRYFVRDFVRDLDWLSAPHFLQSLQWGVAGDFIRDFVPDFVQSFGQNCKGYCVRDFVRDLELPEIMLGAPWLPGFAILELSSVFGRAAPRAALAYGEVPSSVPLLALFRSACRLSFAPDDTGLRAAVIRAGDCFEGDPLWPALARHVARISTPEDRALLEELARHPEQRAAPLSWGLQYYVRGDLVFDDDSVVTLDELCARAGLSPLPFLEAMPDELDIPLGEARGDRPRLRRGS